MTARHLVVFPRHRLSALSAGGPTDLFQQKALFPTDASGLARKQLGKTYDSDAALVQYVLRGPDGDLSPFHFRLRTDSLPHLGDLKVEMRWLALDWDFEPKDIAWGSPEKPQTADQVRQFVDNHPILKNCFCWYFSKSGARILFELATPFVIDSKQAVGQWKESYRNFVRSLSVPEGTKLELGARCSPFAFNRVPRYVAEGIDTSSREVFFPSSIPLQMEIAPPPAVEPRKKETFVSIDKDMALSMLWAHPFMKHLRESKLALSYHDWRAVGSSVYALLGWEGLETFREISSWGSNYNPSSVEDCWRTLKDSAEQGYGPIRWSQFELDFQATFGGYSPHGNSSLAGAIRRQASPTAKVSPRSRVNPAADNSLDVVKLLSVTTKTKKDGSTETSTKKDIRNLRLILLNDNRWGGLLRRNHLGAIDLYGDERIEDEHITAWRNEVLVSYGLGFSKDDFYDVVRLICWENEFHPVYNYLSPLVWDGVDRIGQLAASMGSEPLYDTFLRKFFISAVVRPLEWLNLSPSVNWKVDTVLILKGPQGHRKSTFFKSLVPDPGLFSDSLPNIEKERKDAALHMMGRWIVEQAEFEGHVARSSVEVMKAFITREREDFRRPYARTEISCRRPSILVGTTNSETFLNDPTGDRRFWVIDLEGKAEIDYAWVVRNRDQLWAQAKHLYESGVQWWLTQPENETNKVLNEKFRRLESYKELVDEFLATNPSMAELSSTSTKFEGKAGFTMKTLTSFALDKKMIEVHPALLSKISTYVLSKGYKRCRVSVQHSPDRIWCYRKVKDNGTQQSC